MKKFFLFFVMLIAFCAVAQDQGTISPDTLIPARTVVIPKQMDGQFFERTYSGDSVTKFNDLYAIKMWVKRAGNPVAFDSSFVVFRPKTRGIDTLNSGHGYIWRIRFELLPR
jgi:hypothetical protein